MPISKFIYFSHPLLLQTHKRCFYSDYRLPHLTINQENATTNPQTRKLLQYHCLDVHLNCSTNGPSLDFNSAGQTIDLYSPYRTSVSTYISSPLLNSCFLPGRFLPRSSILDSTQPPGFIQSIINQNSYHINRPNDEVYRDGSLDGGFHIPHR
jgi:hypothetical protein